MRKLTKLLVILLEKNVKQAALQNKRKQMSDLLTQVAKIVSPSNRGSEINGVDFTIWPTENDIKELIKKHTIALTGVQTAQEILAHKTQELEDL